MSRSRCPDCLATYSPHGGGHCRAAFSGCCSTFANDATAEAHMTQHHPTLICLTPEEMAAPPRNWRLTPRGWTKYRQLTPEERERMWNRH